MDHGRGRLHVGPLLHLLTPTRAILRWNCHRHE